MTEKIGEFFKELNLEIQSHQESYNELELTSFFEVFTNYLIKAEVIDTADKSYCNINGMRVDGYGGDPIDHDYVLNLIVSDYSHNNEVEVINRTDVESLCKKVVKFISKSQDGTIFSEIDESSDEYGLADIIKLRWPQIQRIKIIVISNKSLNVRKQEFEPIPVNGIYADFVPWDINRLATLIESGREKEPIEIELKDFGGSIRALQAHNINSEFDSYLCIMPGEVIANIYEKYRNRLLENNVRVFLQARRQVNKGIKNTIEKNPTMFFGFNNGITATASKVDKELTKHGFVINYLKDFQIVNGGQTTVSIHEAFRKKVDISDIYIQMKLTIVDLDKEESDLVSKISEYANSQNKVRTTDFSSNHPFQVLMETLSRKIVAPQKKGTIMQTKWFYERARGQYAQQKSSFSSQSEKKKFENIYPKNQMVDKGALSITAETFSQNPFIVCRGEQKCFDSFAKRYAEKWAKQGEENTIFNERYFRVSMAKVLIFRTIEKLVPKQEWYEKGYRRAIVAYGISKLVFSIKKQNKNIDYQKIWNDQSINSELEECLIDLTKIALDHINNPPPGATSDIKEYSKTEKCWEIFKTVNYDLPENSNKFLISKEKDELLIKEGLTVKKFQNEVDLEKYVIELGGKFWSKVLEYGSQRTLFSQSDWALLSRASAIPNKIPSSKKEYQKLLKLLERVENNGFIKP